MSENSELFDSARPVGTERLEEQSTVMPPELAEMDLAVDDEDREVDEMLPVRWLLGKQARVQILEGAVSDLYDGHSDTFENKSEIADRYKPSRKTISVHIDELASFGIYEKDNSKYTKYRINEDSPILRALTYIDRQLRDQGPPPE